MKQLRMLHFGATFCMALALGPGVPAQGSAFTYQGLLTDTGGPATGTYDLQFTLYEAEIPIRPTVRSAAEMLGLDPLHIANEGKAIIGVRAERAEEALAAMQAHPLGGEAAIVGECTAEKPGRVVLDTGLGRRLVSEPEGEPLPRIC